jgi:hypothetical protein
MFRRGPDSFSAAGAQMQVRIGEIELPRGPGERRILGVLQRPAGGRLAAGAVEARSSSAASSAAPP